MCQCQSAEHVEKTPFAQKEKVKIKAKIKVSN